MRAVVLVVLALFVPAQSALARFTILGGWKFEDLNGNGTWEQPAEPPVAGWTMSAVGLDDGTIYTAVTGPDGRFDFLIFDEGLYAVSEATAPGWRQTFPGGNGTHFVYAIRQVPIAEVLFGNQRLCMPPPTHMRGWWTLDEDIGSTAFDYSSSAFGDEGRHRGNPEEILGLTGRALRFDGGSNFVEVPSSADISIGTEDLTIDAWVRTTSKGTVTLVDKRSDVPIGFTLFLVAGRLGFQLADRDVPSATGCSSNNTVSGCSTWIAPGNSNLVNDAQWHHVAVTVDRDSTTGGVLYVDGAPVLVFDPTARPLSLANTAPLVFARSHPNRLLGTTVYFPGDLDEIELFNRALAAEEVRAIFTARSAGKCKGVCGPPSLIQSNLGARGDFELVVPDPAGGTRHYRRDNDSGALPWSTTGLFGTSQGNAEAASLIQSNYFVNGNFEVVARYGDALIHFWRDNDLPSLPWSQTVGLASGVRGTPSLVQGVTGTQRDFELVVPLSSGGLAYYRRANDAGHTWIGPEVFGTAAGVFDDASLIVDIFGTLQVVARAGDRLAEFERVAGVWSAPRFFANGVSGTPALVLGQLGLTVDVAAPLATGGIGHWTRLATPGSPWSGVTVFAAGEGHFHSVTMIYSNYSNLEAVGQQCGRLVHYWSRSPAAPDWQGPFPVTP